MTIEKVYSPVYDPDIKKNIIGSNIWKECYHETDTKPDKDIVCYHIKFDGTKPIQVTKIVK